MCFPLQAGSTFLKMSVMLSRAFQNGNFPLVRQKILFFKHYKARGPPSPSHPRIGQIGGCEPWGGFRRGKENSSKKKKEERKKMQSVEAIRESNTHLGRKRTRCGSIYLSIYLSIYKPCSGYFSYPPNFVFVHARGTDIHHGGTMSTCGRVAKTSKAIQDTAAKID